MSPPRRDSLDWLHLQLQRAKWVCLSREKPRSWHLCLPFRMFPKGCRDSKETAMGVVISERDIADPQTRRNDNRKSFRMAKEALQIDIANAAITGRMHDDMSGREAEFDYLMPIGIETVIPQNVEEFDDAYELLQGGEPHQWVLRDRKTDAVISFLVPEGATDAQKHRAATEVMIRMQALNRRLKETQFHATLPS